MTALTYNIIAGLLTLIILYGLSLMSQVKTAVRGNMLCALAMGIGIIITMYKDESLGNVALYVSIAAGMVAGLWIARVVKMIQMPQLVAFFNGIGGGTAAIVGLLMLVDTGATTAFARTSASLALITGMMTIAGAFVAAGKLHQILPQKPIRLPSHDTILKALIAIMVFSTVVYTINPTFLPYFLFLIMFASGTIFGIAFTVRVGGADMPITISLLNSLAGISDAIAGLAIGDPLLVAVGGIIGSSGIFLTRVMCKAMNRSLLSILTGASSAPSKAAPAPTTAPTVAKSSATENFSAVLASAKKVIIVPGYGMALAQAQHNVKKLAEALEQKGAQVDYAIHPVAGRMPGHMNVLLAEAGVDYEQLKEMDEVNPEFANTDLVIIVGANDVVNPAAMHAEGTPIYGMPILRADEAKHTVICNFDTKPGYAGVNNPLYESKNATLMLGDASKTVDTLINMVKNENVAPSAAPTNDISSILANVKKAIIVPGYGMALAQAQHNVKKLAEALEQKGAQVDYAIHPVAGRMPGHMNVLLAEAGVDYEQLKEMDEVNPEFANTDLVIIVGANDVVNPAAMHAEGTPIYGMPILRADEAKHAIICNFDTKPGYAGVDNPLYESKNATLMLGDASKTVDTLINMVKNENVAPAGAPTNDISSVLANVKKAIIVPGYGMALAQAQHNVKKLAEVLEKKGAQVDYAIHPVAGRMPGHMNVLLAEAGVDYEQLKEMDEVNPEFANTDLVIIVGANDVVNPAAMHAEGTPIYGMPILRADEAKHAIICNFDTKPGYAGVDNPLYESANATLMLGDASKTVDALITMIENGGTGAQGTAGTSQEKNADAASEALLNQSQKVIIVPGYGMALAQAQHSVKNLADALEERGAQVDYAIHPVAGRMPGHMNVLLAEAGVDYEKLKEMDEVNPEFANTDLVIIVGANDVVNPAAMHAEGTPIYGMPILRADEAKNIIICNYDMKPGYAGVDNPLYSKDSAILLLGDAAQTVEKLVQLVQK